jgi:hypothetical protein
MMRGFHPGSVALEKPIPFRNLIRWGYDNEKKLSLVVICHFSSVL